MFSRLFRKRRRRPSWVRALSPGQKRRLARNLRDLVDSKASIERRISRAAPLR